MRWLYSASHDRVKALFAQLLTTVAFHMDYGSWLRGSSADPLQMPLLEGPAKRRRLHPTLKGAIVQAAAEGSLARTASKAMQ
eukprot:9363116-Lingulodinium_polyedra.AAC.1